MNSTDQINHMAVQNAFLTCFVISVKAVQILCWCQKFRGSIAYKCPVSVKHTTANPSFSEQAVKSVLLCSTLSKKTTKHNMHRRECWFCIPRFRYILKGECVEIYFDMLYSA